MKLQFPKNRRYPIALATFLMYLAWHPLGDFIESVIIGWNIVPCQLFTNRFWTWWVPVSRSFNQSYTLAFFAYFIPVTLSVYLCYFLYQKLRLNKYLAAAILLLFIFFSTIPPAFFPEHSVAYQNDLEGFARHQMRPLQLWMAFHMSWWFLWMLAPQIVGLFTSEKKMIKIAGLVWFLFLAVWIGSFLLGRIVDVPIEVPFRCN